MVCKKRENKKIKKEGENKGKSFPNFLCNKEIVIMIF
jgi:hypothetical protein